MNKIVTLICASAMILVAGAAQAGQHEISADSTKRITYYTCNDFSFVARGDGDTDLDFRIISPVGQTVFVDDDMTDFTWGRVSVGSCGTYTFYVRNYGDIWNMLSLTIR